MPFFHHHHDDGGGGQRQSAPSLPPPSKPSTEFIALDPAAVRLRHESQRLEFRGDPDDDWRQVTLVRLFPLSEPDGWIAVLDAEGNEIGILLDVADLPSDTRTAADEELRRRYLVPQVLRILACRTLRHGLIRWTVETDKGEASFITRHLREQIKEPMPQRLTLVDVEGSRYDVPDLDALDPESRRMLETRI